jgi:hypothetical protein
MRTVTLPPLSVTEQAKIQDEDVAAASSPAKGKLRIGVGRQFDQPLTVNQTTPATDWLQLADGSHVWTARITSTGAAGSRVHLESLNLPRGVQLLVYDPAQPAPAAPVSLETLYGQQDTWMESVMAETVMVECRVAPQVNPSTVRFAITGVSHFYRPLDSTATAKDLACENDVTCYRAWTNTASGVARIYFVDAGNAYLCTGCLLNTLPSTFAPYFLTANHCINNQNAASTLELWWFYQTTVCNGTPPSSSNVPHTTGGAVLLAGSPENDFTFLRLHQEPPAGAAYLGWSTGSPRGGDNMTSIHHPGQPPDDYKRISFGSFSSSDFDFWYVHWNNGTTEEGSSGSPLFNQNQQVIGQLYGGDLACPPNAIDQYGRFDGTYNLIHQWLEPAPPANDHCSGAVALTNNVYYSQSTDSATDDTEPCAGTISKGVWFTFKPTVLGTATVNANSSDFSTLLEVFTGGCGALQSLLCDFDTVTFTCVPGTTYRICAGGYLGGSGTLGLRASAVAGSVSILDFGSTLDFGSIPVGQTATRNLILTNSGNTTLNISGLSLPSGLSGDWSGSIPAPGSQTVPLTFTPSTQASYSAPLVVNSDATLGSGIISVSASGYYPLARTWSLWWQHTNGTVAVWSLNGTNLISTIRANPANPGANWNLVAAADFNSDQQTDLVFESNGGLLAAWLMNGANRQAGAYLTPGSVDPKWRVMATGDLNGDGQRDLLWQSPDGTVAAWLMNGLVTGQSLRLNSSAVDPSWRLAGSADFNGDNQTDLLFQNKDGRLTAWLMNGTAKIQSVYLNPRQVDPKWTAAAIVDFNQDGHPGIIWQHITGSLSYWQMDGTNNVHSGRLNPASVDPAWHIVGPR